ncbi:hypothetical protein HDE_13476 [Halotydeus destructor]|nr:hypothetical protein HDE_13476 [Halotydeus destructor]
MNEDILETDEEEEEKENLEDYKPSRSTRRLQLENGDQNLYLLRQRSEHEEELLDVEVDSRLGDTSDDDVQDIGEVNEPGSVDRQIHVDYNSESLGAAVSHSLSPTDPQGPSSSSFANWPSGFSAGHHSPSYEYSRDSHTHVLPVSRDHEFKLEEDEGSGRDTNRSEQLIETFQSDEDVEREVQEVTEELVHRIANECWNCVNGTYQGEEWHEWDETVSQVNPYDDETFLILPYVHTGW